jgi:hypothetical protein
MRHRLRHQRVEARDQFAANVSGGAFVRIRLVDFRASQTTQIIGHVTELPESMTQKAVSDFSGL